VKNWLLGLFYFFSSGLTIGQNTTNCVDITSILVDACAPSDLTEKENEMLRFQVGPNALSIGSMSMTFGYNQPFSGIRYPDGFTASKIAFLNSTILGCGFLREPVNGILPANSKVLFITSPNFNTATNSFAGLTDTLYVIFQNSASSFDAYFINYPLPTTMFIPDAQTTSISFGGGCSDVVTYRRSQLVNQSGVQGRDDGATVYFDFNGNPSYRNNGCSAPVSPLSAEWNNPGTVCDNAPPVNLAALVRGTAGGVFTGSGVSGNQFSPAGLSGQVQITYTVSANGCQRTRTQTVNVVKVQPADWTPPQPVCAGTVVNLVNLLSGGAPGGTWSGSGVSGNSMNTTGLSGQIPVTYRLGSGACQTTVTRNIQVIANANPAWNPPASICNSAAPLNLNSLGTGTAGGIWSGQGVANGFFDPSGLNGAISIKYKVGNGSCADSSLKTINVLPGPAAPVVSGTLGYCNGQTPEPLSAAGEPGAVFRWYGNAELNNLLATGSAYTPSSSGGSFWVVQDLAGCRSRPAEVTVTISPRPPAPQIDDEVVFCSGAAEPLFASGGSGNFLWYRDAALTNRFFEGNPLLPDFDVDTELWVVEDRGGCVGQASKTMLKPLPGVQAEIIPLGGLLICDNGSILLRASGSPGYTWSTGDTAQTIQVFGAGPVILSVTGICNEAKDTIWVVRDSVTAYFDASPGSGEAPLIVTFNPDITPSSSCDWSINGQMIDDPSLTPYVFEENGSYVITRVCQSPGGCKDQFSRTINVSGQLAELFIPNSFSPNNDGLNEVFSVKGFGIEKIKVFVFNRWGEVLYSWQCLEECGWDGTYAGAPVPAGVYSIKVEAIDKNGEKIFRTGKVNVIY
jgi:gliding motility-associated-like protein